MCMCMYVNVCLRVCVREIDVCERDVKYIRCNSLSVRVCVRERERESVCVCACV